MLLTTTTAISSSVDPGTVWWGLPIVLAAVALGAWVAGTGRPVGRGVVRRGAEPLYLDAQSHGR